MTTSQSSEGENMRIEQEEDRKAKFEEITEFIATVRANEGNRESNERERQTNEDTRITEEAKRVEAEKRRATEFEQQKLDLSGKVDRYGDEMGGDLTFTDYAGVSFRTSDGGAHTIFNDTDDVAKFTADNGDTFEFTQDETPNKNSSAVVVSANLYNALDMALESMGSALDGDAAYRVEAGDTIFNPDTCKIQRYNSTVGGFEDLCDPIDGKLYANKMTGYIYRWEPKTKKMVFVGGVKAYTKDEADSRFAKLKDETQTVNVKELNANNFVSTKSMWIGDEGLILGGDGNGHLTVEEDEVITDVTLNEKMKGKADDVAIGVEWENGQPSGQLKEMTVKEATSLNAATALIAGFSYNSLSGEVEKKADKTELNNYATKEYVQTNAPQETKESIEEKLGAWLEEDGGEADGEVYTKAESDARYLRGEFEYCGLMEWDGKNEVKIYEMKFDSPKREVFIYGQCKWDNTNRGQFKIIITNEKYPSDPYGISHFSSSSMAEECFHIHNVCGNYVCDINESNNHLVPSALKRCYMGNLLTNQRREDVGLITNLKIEITTDLVRIDGVQKWYVFGKK